MAGQAANGSILLQFWATANGFGDLLWKLSNSWALIAHAPQLPYTFLYIILHIYIYVCDYICISLSLVEVSNSKSNSPACLQIVYIEQCHTKAWGETSTQLTAVYSHLVYEIYESNYRCWGHPPSSTRHIEDSGGTSHGCSRCSQPSPQMTWWAYHEPSEFRGGIQGCKGDELQVRCFVHPSH